MARFLCNIKRHIGFCILLWIQVGLSAQDDVYQWRGAL